MQGHLTRIFSISILLLIVLSGLFGQGKDRAVYSFGHSLIDHRPPLIPTPSDETTILHWIYDIADASSNNFTATGQYGFLTNHDDLPPGSQWGYDNVPTSWDDSMESFENSKINTILLTAANFIQYESPTAPHPLDATTTVVNSTNNIFNWVDQRCNDCTYYIYENWPEMDLVNAFPTTPPTEAEVNEFHNTTINGFNDWWIEYQDEMINLNTDYDVKMIPVGPIIAKILSQFLNEDIPFEELYEDSAPHGRASIYFLAGAISYMAVYEEQLPANYTPDAIVHEMIRNNLSDIAQFIWTELNAFNFSNGESRVFQNELNTNSAEIYVDASSIEVLPNPTMGEVMVHGSVSNFEVDVLNSNGTIFQSHTANNDTIQIDLSAVPSGLYFLRVRHKQLNQLNFRKIIKW